MIARENINEALGAIAGFVCAPTLALLVLVNIGHPALRWTYQWNGNADAPVIYQCTYLSLTGGFTERGKCPLIRFVPLTLWRS